jgi:uncharacterized membrane protein
LHPPGVVPSSRSSESRKDPAGANIRAIVELERQARRHETRSERLGRRISDLVGTLGFVWLQVALMVFWALWNLFLPPGWRFDPYPFGLLTFIVSLEGVLIATFVLIAQNQMSRQSDERDHLDLQVDLLAEQEMTLMLRMLQRISERLGIPIESGELTETERLTEETDVVSLAEKLRAELPDTEGRT